MFGALKQKLAGSVNKYSGKKDFLEAVCAASALVAAAEGDIDDKEVAAAIKAITANAALSSAFTSREIEGTASLMFDRAVGRAGKVGLHREIDDVINNNKSDKDMPEIILCTALDVADSDGSIGDAERNVLGKIASQLGLKLADYE